MMLPLREPGDEDEVSSGLSLAGPSPLTLRERRRRETAELIVAAARRSFAERGYPATRVAAIAAEVGVSEATVFRYFPNKSDLATVALRERWAMLADRLAGQPAELGELDAARNVLADAVDLQILGPDDPVLQEMALLGSTPELDPAVPVLVNALADDVMVALARRQGREEPSFRDGVMSRVIVTAAWAASQWWFGNQSRPISEWVAEAFDIVDTPNGPRP